MSIDLPKQQLKPWQRMLCAELEMIQNPTDVMCAITKVLARYKVDHQQVIAFVAQLGARARQLHADNAKKEVQA